MFTIDDIPERFRNDPNLIIYNGQNFVIRISEKVCDELGPIMLDLDDKKESI